MQQIGRKDVIWNFAGTFMRIASGIIVLPLVLRLLPSQEIGLWNIFLTIGSLAALLDFGFSNAFSRNITYIFSGVKELKTEGYVIVNKDDQTIHYGLLKSVISAMRFYYGILAGIFLLLFVIISPFYLSTILQHYTGNIHEIWTSWFTYGILVAYQLYTYYYGALLNGRGMIRRSLQITIISQSFRIVITVIFLLCGLGLMSLVIGLLISDLLNRTLSYFTFYDKNIKVRLKNSEVVPIRNILKILTPNAIKIGITVIRGFLINHATMLIAPLYLSLSTIAEFGTSRQMIELISSLGMLWYNTYYPKMTFYRVNGETENLKRSYLKSNFFLLLIFIVCGAGLLLVGPPLLVMIHSKTHLLSTGILVIFLLIAFLEVNSGMATSFLVTKNEVPFFKANIISGVCSFLLVLALFNLTSLGVLSILLGQGISQAAYQNWKWPLTVARELHFRPKDYWITLQIVIKENFKIC